MSKIDLNKFASQISRLERANQDIEVQASKLSPKHILPKPVHVLYGGAHLFNENTFDKISKLSLDAFLYAAPNSKELRTIANQSWSDQFVDELYAKVQRKITALPLEDFRIDFEDGYGVRPEEEEDAHARSAGELLAKLYKLRKLPPQIGFRIKPLSNQSMRRSLRTLGLFVSSLAANAPKDFNLKHLIVTLPKVTNPEQVATLVDILHGFETDIEVFDAGFFQIEILIESPEAFLNLNGNLPLASMLEAAKGRCQSLHLGIYDFTSSLGIGSAGQAIDHLSCDFARMWMQIIAGLAPGLGLSDGIINRLPMIPKVESEQAKIEFAKTWQYNYQQMYRSLTNGYYQGWDLHPCQSHIRHVVNHVFVFQELDSAVARLKTFIDKSSQASHVNGLFDDRASVLGLLNFFERAVWSGILTENELQTLGIDLQKIREGI